MMSVETGQYFSLNEVGAHIWRLMEAPRSLDSIVAALIDAYDAPAAAIREEALGFSHDWNERTWSHPAPATRPDERKRQGPLRRICPETSS